jgi:hypothetical protein
VVEAICFAARFRRPSMTRLDGVMWRPIEAIKPPSHPFQLTVFFFSRVVTGHRAFASLGFPHSKLLVRHVANRRASAGHNRCADLWTRYS